MVLRIIAGKRELTIRNSGKWQSPNTTPPEPCCQHASYLSCRFLAKPGYAIAACHQHVKDTLTLTLEPLTTALPRCGQGHRDATVSMDAERTRIQRAGKGNSREAIRPFFKLLGEPCKRIEAVAMDMNTAFDREVKQHCLRLLLHASPSTHPA